MENDGLEGEFPVLTKDSFNSMKGRIILRSDELLHNEAAVHV